MKLIGDFISSAIVAIVMIAVVCGIGWIILEILF